MARTWKALELSGSASVAFSAHCPALTMSPLRQVRTARLSATLERWRAFSRTTSPTRASSLSMACSRASTPARAFKVGWGRAWAIEGPLGKILLYQSRLTLITRERKHSKIGLRRGVGRWTPAPEGLDQHEHRRAPDGGCKPSRPCDRNRGRPRCHRVPDLRL